MKTHRELTIIRLFAALLLAVCGHAVPAFSQQLACDDGIKTAFHPDADTTVVAVRLVKKGEELLAPDAAKPVTAAADLCLVPLRPRVKGRFCSCSLASCSLASVMRFGTTIL